MVARVFGRGVLPSKENNGTGDKIGKSQNLETLSDLNHFTHTTQLNFFTLIILYILKENINILLNSTC